MFFTGEKKPKEVSLQNAIIQIKGIPYYRKYSTAK